MARLALQTAVRAGAFKLLEDYRSANPTHLATIWRARPAQIKPPQGFVDTIVENADAFTDEESQRVVRVGIRVVWGMYDSGTAVDQRDRFVDGFYAYVMDNGVHIFGGNTVCNWVGTNDDEVWTPSWIPADENSYFSTLITLEGLAST